MRDNVQSVERAASRPPRRRLTTRELSEKLGVTQRTVQYWLAGRVRPSEPARRLMAHLGIQEVGK